MQQGYIKGAIMVALTAGLLLVAHQATRADSPPNPRQDIPWQGDVSTVADIERAYTAARRAEEIQLGLPSGSLGDLDLPIQAEWNRRTDAAKALFLMNAARVARGGSAAGVLGLRFTGLQEDVQQLAQDVAEALVARNAFQHVIDGRDPFQRIEEHPVLGPCTEFISRAENLALLGSSADTIPSYIERAIYYWLYVDAGSDWGHREAILLQDRDLRHQNPAYGFKNNVAGPGTEGFIGIGVVISNGGYDPFGWGATTTALVVMEVVDPLPAPGCPWTVPTTIPPTPGGPTPTPEPTAGPPPDHDFRAFMPILRE